MKDCCVCDPHLTEAGSHNTYLTLCFFLTQHCFLGLSLLKCICIVYIYIYFNVYVNLHSLVHYLHLHIYICKFTNLHTLILMMWLHSTAWLHHNDLSILLLVDFILQPQALVSTCSWAHMITFSAVRAQKWSSWATAYVNFELHSIFAYFFLKVVISINECFYFLSTSSASWNCLILKFQLIWWYALMWNNCISLFQF